MQATSVVPSITEMSLSEELRTDWSFSIVPFYFIFMAQSRNQVRSGFLIAKLCSFESRFGIY